MQVVLLSAPVIDQLLASERFNQHSVFKDPPMLLPPAAKPHSAPKSCCGNNRSSSQLVQVAPPKPAVDYNMIKLRIHALQPDKKLELRTMMGCDLIVMQFKDLVGTVMRDEF